MGLMDLQKYEGNIIHFALDIARNYDNSGILFFTREWTPYIPRFYLSYKVIIPAAPQETVGEAGIELGTAA
jgi:hypothetical protein